VSWLTLSAIYLLPVSIALFFWNHKLDAFLGLWVILSLMAFPVSVFFGVPLVCGVAFPIAMLVSLLGWWYNAQLVKRRTNRIRLVSCFSGILIGTMHILLVLLPIAIWAGWRIATVVAAVNVIFWMRAGAVSADRYVLQRAMEIHNEHPERSFREALSQAESEMRFNVHDDLPY